MGFHQDRRSAPQRQGDRSRLDVQLRRLNNPVGAHRYQRALFETIRGAGRGGGRQSFDFDRLDRGQDFLVAVSGEVLVRSSDQVAAAAVLQPRGFTDASPVLEGRVIRFRKQGASAVEANNMVRTLQGMGIRATVNHVVPLGYVAKGEGGFENTTVAPSNDGPGTADGAGVQVAVVDTGVADEHRTDGWLRNMHLTGGSTDTDPLYQPGQKPLLDFAAGHGTFVAGIIQQIAPEARIRSYLAVHSNGIGSELDIAGAIVKAGDDGARLINLSLGTETDGNQAPVGLEAALAILASRHPDVLVIAAAGNSGSTAKCWPAAFPTVVGVASLTAAMQGSAWSNHGDWVRCSAVGEGVVSTYVEGREDPAVDKDGPDVFGPESWALGTGTSFAAPQITGSLAQRMSADPSLTTNAVLQQLLSDNGARPVPGYGIAVEVLPGT